MQKSNWIIFGILLIGSLIFLGIWFYFGLDLIDRPFDLVLTIIWWVVLIGFCIGISLIERARREKMRTVYLAPQLAYNREVGTIQLKSDESIANTVQEILESLDYGFTQKRIAKSDSVRFKVIVHTTKFKDNGNTWEGEVIDVAQPGDPQKFKNRAQLDEVLADYPVLLA